MSKADSPTYRTGVAPFLRHRLQPDRKSTRLNSSHRCISYAVFCLKKKNKIIQVHVITTARKERFAVRPLLISLFLAPFTQIRVVVRAELTEFFLCPSSSTYFPTFV